MPAKDIYHNLIKTALENDQWTITHDPLQIPFGGKKVYIDLAAERVIAAEKGEHKIAVEIKSFLRPSPLNELHTALGQYQIYKSILKRRMPDRILFLTIPNSIYDELFETALGNALLEDYDLKLIIFDPDKGVITKWLPELK